MLILLPIAFISGVLTVFSPCVLPILPIVLSSGFDGNKTRVRGTIMGIILSFTVATLSLATIVSLFGISADTIRSFAVILLVIFGFTMLVPKLWDKIAALLESKISFTPKQSSSTFWGGFITGVSLGIVWTPCVGPIVATVATLAATSSLSLFTVILVFAFALGTGLPLYFIAQGGASVSARLTIFKSNSNLIRQVFGIIILLTALMIASGADRAFQSWTLSNLPERWTNLAETFETSVMTDQNINMLNQTSGTTQPSKEVVKNVKLSTDFTGAKIAQSDLDQGCPRKDCIPSIDNPVFETATTATWLDPDDVVFAIDFEGATRAYPQRILNWHEIVNDWAGDTPIAITFCPLCGSAVGFVREINGTITQLGVSGFLHDSDLVMYDRFEGSLWQQISGEAIVGPAAQRNESLEWIPVFTSTWEDWVTQHPETEVLSRDTGYRRDYDHYPYRTYEEDDQLRFGVENLDQSLQIKTPVFGIEIGEVAKAYPAAAFDSNQTIIDSVNNQTIKLEMSEGILTVTNQTTNEEIIPIRLFWFAWATFHPSTELYN